jgi:hypothetical protein
LKSIVFLVVIPHNSMPQSEKTRQRGWRHRFVGQIDPAPIHLQTLKLSPQPHASLTLGLLNLNPSLKPSRV